MYENQSLIFVNLDKLKNNFSFIFLKKVVLYILNVF
mgnify:CR=1 FL=1